MCCAVELACNYLYVVVVSLCVLFTLWVVINYACMCDLVAEAHKVKVEEHLYQNVQLRTRVRSADDKPPIPLSPKPNRKHSSVPPDTPPPPVGPKPGFERPPPVGPKPGDALGDAEYSIVSQDWIEKKRSGAQKATATTNTSGSKIVETDQPPALPPRSELADELDEDLYDLPIIHDDIKKVLPSDQKTASSSSVTVDNTLYQSTASAKTNDNKPATPSTVSESSEATYDVIADVKTSLVNKNVDNTSSRKSPVERKTPGSSPAVNKKTATLPKPSSEATYDVIAEVHAGKSLTMPSSNHRSPSPEYAVVRKSPVLSHALNRNAVKPESPIATRSSGEYSSVSASAAVTEADTPEEVSNSEYDVPITARRKELCVNCPPSPNLSNYAKLQYKDGVHNDKQEWKLPKQPAADFKKKTSKSVSVDLAETSKPNPAVNSVDKTIEELKKGLNDDSGQTKNRVQSLDLTKMLPKTSDGSLGDAALDWDDTDMPANVSAVQQGWLIKHQQSLTMRSYEEVQLPPEATNSPSLPEKLRHGWSPRDDSGNEKLPPGWSKVIGEDGVYYWHVKSGKTQWTLPTEPVNSDKVK